MARYAPGEVSKNSFLGSKVRRIRQEYGLTQVHMAARLGISPSYLNLIEHNQRVLTLPLIERFSESFGIDVRALSTTGEARMLADLVEIFADPLFHEGRLERSEVMELVGSAPKTAQAMIDLYRAYQNSLADVRALSDRLLEDPYLASTSHRLLTLLTSVHSFAEILKDHSGLAEPKRKEFASILVEESEKLTGLVNELFAFIGEGLQDRRPSEGPGEEAVVIIQGTGNHFAALERAAEDLAQTLPGDLPGAPAPPGEPGGTRPEEASWRQARLLAEHRCADSLAAVLVSLRPKSSQAAAALRSHLLDYLASAALMPYGPFAEAARDHRHDLDLLAERFGTSVDLVCQRLTTLTAPGREGVPFHFLKLDIAGNVLKQLGFSGLRLPRSGGICPLWNVHRAFRQPEETDVQLARMPDGTRYLFLARASVHAGARHGDPVRHTALTLGCEADFAGQVVYADGIDLGRSGGGQAVGTNCSRCPRTACAHRAAPPVVAAF